MNDTQWPRYQVFLQEKIGEPYQDVGSVHAPDPELALQNARDVFSRRPFCTGIWVVPVEQIFSRTREELESWVDPKIDPVGMPETYLVFCKEKSTGTATQSGSVSGFTPETAMQAALHKFAKNPPAFTWWVFPETSVTASQREDAGAMFNPALDKPFRQSSFYHVVTAMREAERGNENEG